MQKKPARKRDYEADKLLKAHGKWFHQSVAIAESSALTLNEEK